MCFNPACNERGNLFKLMRDQIHCNDFEATRLIQKFGKASEISFEQRISEVKAIEVPTPWHPELLESMGKDFWQTPVAQDYMHGRGFNDETLLEFNIGYSAKQGMVTVPVHYANGVPAGLVGRSIEGKTFKNSTKLPNTKTLFNFHRARRHGNIVIVTESCFDTMRVHQAGFPNVVGTLGGYMSPDRYSLIDRSFGVVIIMTDNDVPKVYKDCRKCYPHDCAGHNPGRDLGMAIANTLRNKNVLWASYDYKQIYADGAKDAGDMSDSQIEQCINNSVSHLEYLSWNT